jgi:Arc/MetJ-type ribon-helix-helix transcriptional regulator
MEKQLTIRVSRQLHQEIGVAARRLRRSRSEIVRLALEAWLAGGRAATADATTPWERVEDLIGITESGVADLGSSHREHVLTTIRESSARWRKS